jgi:hypothetical protein
MDTLNAVPDHDQSRPDTSQERCREHPSCILFVGGLTTRLSRAPPECNSSRAAHFAAPVPKSSSLASSA